MDEFARVKQSVDLAEVIGRYVKLQTKGSRLVGLCPFHAEKTPSFGVHPQRQFYKCFGCGESGDVFSFVSKHLRLSKGEALRTLAREAGITLDSDTPEARRRRDEDEKTLELLDTAAKRYSDVLWSEEGRPVRAFLEARGIAPDVARRFGLGFAPRRARLGETLRAEGVPLERLERAGLARMRDDRLMDAFWARLMIPIRDPRGHTVAFGARRTVDGPNAPEPKYLNSKDGPVFHKGRVLYGMDLAREGILKARQVVLVEGYTDVIHAHAAGLDRTVAALGTAVTAGHAKQLKRLADTAVLFLDGDAAGQRAARRAVPILMSERLRVRVVSLADGQDPGDFFHGGKSVEEFDSMVETEGKGGVDFLLEVSGVTTQRGPEERAAAIETLIEELGSIEHPLVRATAIQRVAEEVDLSPELLLQEARDRRRVGRSRPALPEGRARRADRAPSDGPPLAAWDALLDAQAEDGGEGLGTSEPRPEAPAAPVESGSLARAEEDLVVALLQRPEMRETFPQLIPEAIYDAVVRESSFWPAFQAMVDEPDLELDELLEQIADHPALCARVSALADRPPAPDPGRLLDGAVQYFKRGECSQGCRSLKDDYRHREQGVDDSVSAQDQLEFLTRYMAQIRQRPT